MSFAFLLDTLHRVSRFCAEIFHHFLSASLPILSLQVLTEVYAKNGHLRFMWKKQTLLENKGN